MHVGDAVAQHQCALDAHAEREARIDLGINTVRAQHVRVDHAATTPLDPTGATLLLGEPQVHLSAGLGEREVRGTQTGLGLGTKHRLREVVKDALQMRHRQPLVDSETLDLVEHRRVGRVERVGAENLTGACHVQRNTAGEHCVGLDWGGVRAHHEVRAILGLGTDATAVNVERVLHLARWVIDVEVQRVEVEPLVLNLGAFGDIPAHRHEKVGDLFHEGLQGMTRTRRATRGR